MPPQTVNCHVPVQIRLCGAPTEDVWAVLETALERRFADALRRSGDELSRRGLLPRVEEREAYKAPGAGEPKGKGGQQLTPRTATGGVSDGGVPRGHVRRATAAPATVGAAPATVSHPLVARVNELHALRDQAVADVRSGPGGPGTQVRGAGFFTRGLSSAMAQDLRMMQAPTEPELLKLDMELAHEFEEEAWALALSLLEQNKRVAEAEHVRYVYAGGASAKAQARWMRDAARHLADVQQQILNLTGGRAEDVDYIIEQTSPHPVTDRAVADVRSRPGGPGTQVRGAAPFTRRLSRAMAHDLRMMLHAREFEELKTRYRGLKRIYAEAFPVMARWHRVDWRELAEADEATFEERVTDATSDVLKNITEALEGLKEKRSRVWLLEPVVDRTMVRMGIAPGSPAERVIRNFAAGVLMEKDFKNAAIAGLGLALGIGAIILSAGTATPGVAAVVVALEAGTAALSVYTVVEQIEEYQFEAATYGSALNPAETLSREEPSLFWLAVDIIVAVVDLRAATLAFRQLAQSARTLRTAADLANFEELARAEARALAAAGNLKPGVTETDVAARFVESARRQMWTKAELDRFEKHIPGFANLEGRLARSTEPMFIVRVGEAGPGKGGGMWGAAVFRSKEEAEKFARWLATHPEEELRRWFAIPHQWQGGAVSRFEAAKVFTVPPDTAMIVGPVAPQLEAATRMAKVAGLPPEELARAGERAITVPGGGSQVLLDPAVRVEHAGFEIRLTPGEPPRPAIRSAPGSAPPVEPLGGTGAASVEPPGGATGAVVDSGAAPLQIQMPAGVRLLRATPFRRVAEKLDDLERAAPLDPEAGQQLAWYNGRTADDLRELEAGGDPIASDLLDRRYGGEHRPWLPDRPSHPQVQDALRKELVDFRAEVESFERQAEAAGRLTELPPRLKAPSWMKTERTPLGEAPVTPTAKQLGRYRGTLGVAQSDIPALEGRTFRGASPEAGGTPHAGGRIKSPAPAKLTQAHGHAEEDLGNQLDAVLSGLSPEQRAQARGRTFYIRVDQAVCSGCAQGIDSAARAGVLLQLSRLHPDIVFEVAADDISRVIRLLNGRAP